MSKVKNLEAALARSAPPKLELAAPAPRKIPFKMTVLLAGDLRQILKEFPDKLHLPDRTGKATIAGADVIRALIRELNDNEELQTAVAKRIVTAMERES